MQNNCALTKNADGGGDITGGGGGTAPGGSGGDGGDGGGGDDDSAAPPVCSPILYTVQAGDTLTSIADATVDTQQVTSRWLKSESKCRLLSTTTLEYGLVLSLLLMTGIT